MTLQEFIDRWKPSGGSERGNFQTFAGELCDVLGVPRPNPNASDPSQDLYVFEKDVTFYNAHGETANGRADMYKMGCFVMEAKQGSDAETSQSELGFSTPKQAKTKKGMATRGTGSWDNKMEEAYGQAVNYVRALPASEGRPPFVIVVDVGYSFEIYAEFSRSGGHYTAFPDANSHRFYLDDLATDSSKIDLLRDIWLNPMSLDPTRINAKVTKAIAGNLATLARLLERGSDTQPAQDPETVAGFLMRCIFTMFAEDVGLLPERSFVTLLESLREDIDTDPDIAPAMLRELWQKMNTGGFAPTLRTKLLKFNGGLFANPQALPLTREQLDQLILAAEADWRNVEPAIFGTLLERALSPQERHKLGAHYTPRAYVERLVTPTVIEPLRNRWQALKVEIYRLQQQASAETDDKKAADLRHDIIDNVRNFHADLCRVRILDPACGSGNFLYVTLELLKRLEGDVLDVLRQFGELQEGFDMPSASVDPHQFLGLEVNPRAAKIAELVLWIGYLQWQFRTRGKNAALAEPVLRDFHNIACRDAVLVYDEVKVKRDDKGKPVTRWDGHTMKKHPVTGEDVPDENARVEALEYVNPKRAEWPAADYMVGNPPFIGIAAMRQALGDGYTETLRKTYKELPDSVDFVMYWWHMAAGLLRAGKIRRFGFVTTNSLRQTFNRRVLQMHMSDKKPLSLLFAIPDHPWVDTADGAAVRIAMTAAAAGEQTGVLQKVVSEDEGDIASEVTLNQQTGKIFSDLTIGADVASTVPLKANLDLSNRGVQLFGSGFIVTKDEAAKLGLGKTQDLENHIREYRNGRDITAISRDVMVIDMFGLSADEVRSKFPAAYQHLLEHVKPERDTNNRKSRRENWWLFGETNPKLRRQLAGLPRYIATVETSKHRFFTFLDASILPDNMLVNIALDDAYFLGVLSSRVHTTWVTANAASLGMYIGNVRYTKTRCFEPFPFPDATEAQKDTIRKAAESLDKHRKDRQAAHPDLTLTNMYNVLEKLRAGETLSDKDKTTHQQGLVSVLKELHDNLDTAVAAAYGFPTDISDADILSELVELNKQRAAEEKRGLVRWLRPEYQHSDGTTQTTAIDQPTETITVPPTAKRAFPKAKPERALVIQEVLESLDTPATVEDIAQHFTRAPRKDVTEILSIMHALKQVQQTSEGRYLSP